MNLNCKAGDWALVVGGRNPLNVGCVVEVVSLDHHEVEPTWFVRGLIDGNPRARDMVLRPLRHSEGEDEMLSFAGRPAIIP